MSSDVSTSVGTDPEPYIREFLRLIDEGWEPDLEEYLTRVPDALRDKVSECLDEEFEQRSEASWDKETEEVEVEEECVAELEDQPSPADELVAMAEEEPVEPPAVRQLFEEPEAQQTADDPAIQPMPEEAEEPQSADAGAGQQLSEDAEESQPADAAAIRQLFQEAAEHEPIVVEDQFELEGAPGWPSLDGYRIESELGCGSFGQSYLAWDEANRRQVVLKFTESSLPEKVSERAFREAEKAAALDHPGVLTFEQRIGNVLVAPYLEGAAVHQVEAGIDLLLAVARCLDAAHADNVLHLDLKPSNVLVTPEGDCVLLDFGVGSAVLSVPSGTASIGGLPHYESPEHANRMRLGPESDVFSFGSLMYRILTGEFAFPGGAPERIRERIEAAEPTPLRVHDESIPQALQDICLSCFARKTNERPTMGEVADDLERFLEGRSVRLRPRYYREVLRKRVREVVTEVKGWHAQGLATDVETSQLETVCHRLLAREEQWTHDTSHTPRLTRILPVGALLFAIAGGVMVRFGYAYLHPAAWIVPLVGTLGLLGAGLIAALREERTLSTPLLAGGLAALLPALAGVFQGIELLNAKSLALPGLSWLQLAVAAGAVFLGSVCLLAWLRDATYAWLTCAAFTVGFVATLGVFGLSGWLFMPLALLLVAARQFEVHDRHQWARPFFWTGLAALLGVPAYLAIGEPLLISAIGAGMLAASLLFRQSISFSFQTTARWFGAIAPGVILAGLCLHASTPVDWVFALAASIVMVAHGAWFGQRGSMAWGMAGLLVTAAMPAINGLATPWIYATVVGGLGLLATVTIAIAMMRSREP
ncbi:MAG: protein kinase domain-containing protein [Planctomycetota bacterium]|jgi:hypothetical protein